jgi:hypothetical protein
MREVVFHRQIERLIPDRPGGERPRSWLSMRRDSCRSVPMMQTAGGRLVMASLPVSADARPYYQPGLPAAAAAASELGFVAAAEFDVGPRPAIFVAMVTFPGMPAFSTMCASARAAWRSVLVRDTVFLQHAGQQLEVSMDVVPTSTGCSRVTQSRMSSTMALNLSPCVRCVEVRVVLADYRAMSRDHYDLRP